MLKKLGTVVATLLIALAFAVPAFAADDIGASTAATDTQAVITDGNSGESTENSNIKTLKVKELQGYDQLLTLRAEAVQIRSQIAQNNKTINNLGPSFKKSSNKTQAKSIIANYRTQIKQLRTDLKTLWATQKTNWTDMKIAKKAKDSATMQQIMTDKILVTRTDINSKLSSIVTLQQQTIQSLQGLLQPVAQQ
ncbi:hypothetical protein GJ688_19845 [Heliobacillus mobilis]|uniref:Uncharacterized protein n=1 Tax=Heliobacterium mobile TaxID=28064 RepID=A0A6I3SQA0_HELMO|nr:hypothetical protein [Heliobacterium mobile]MTV51089.1 hypothetical protein [Heliobacterium mobile]